MANLREGGRRLIVAARKVLEASMVTAAVAILGALLQFTPFARELISTTEITLIGFVITLWLLGIGISLRVAGWVVQGFGAPPQAAEESKQNA